MTIQYIARQPIFNPDLKLIAYELLYRDSRIDQAHYESGDEATSHVIINSILDLGLDTVAGSHPVFINLGDCFVTGQCPLPSPNKRLVLEVSIGDPNDRALVAGLLSLAKQGFQLALDNFTLNETTAPLLKLCHIVKVDTSQYGNGELKQLVASLRTHKAKLLASKIESPELFAECKKLGFDYFQGYFFSKPNLLEHRAVPGNRLVMLNLLSKLQNPNTTLEALEPLIVQDVSLAYRLLRYINSPFFGLSTEIASIKQALMLVGLDKIKNWASLILLTRIDDKPPELMMTALVRAEMCRQLAMVLERPNHEQYFTVGLFSVLDAMMDEPMSKLLKDLSLTAELQAALNHRQGEMGRVLLYVLSYQHADWDWLEKQDIEADTLKAAYVAAIRWATENIDQLTAEGG